MITGGRRGEMMVSHVYLEKVISALQYHILPLITVSLLPLQLGPPVVPHSSAALLRSGWHRHTGRPNRSQIHSPTKGGYLSKLLPLHVFQRQSATP